LHWVFTAYCVTDLYLLPASLGWSQSLSD
jgi:hypothetical protein